MPIAKVRLPDGSIGRFQVPEGTTPEQVIAFAQSQDLAALQPTQPTQAASIPASFEPTFDDEQPNQPQVSVGEFLEPIATLATGAIAEPVAGIAGLVQAVNPFAEPGAAERAVEATREAITFRPEQETGQRTLEEVGGIIEPVAEIARAVTSGVGDFAFDLTGSPTIAAIAATTPAAIAEIVGLKGLKSIRTGERLIDDVGRPTKILRKALDKEGLDFDSLTPEVKDLIPEVAEPGLIPGSKPVRAEVDQAIKGQLQAGARDDVLAGLKLEGGNVVRDKVGAEAVRQGFTEGFVQSVKTSNPATKVKMIKMSRIMRRIKKQERLGLDIRPSDVVGDSVTERIKFIRDNADTARKDLNRIADKKLPGLEVDTAPIVDSLQSALGDLDIELIENAKGQLKPKFEGSLVSKDRTSRRVIGDLIDLMSEGGRPDALRFHKLKRQLDIMIDFNKKSAQGLTDAGRNVLKQMRSSLNESLRALDPEYARVNDVLSSSLGSLGDIDKAVGTIEIFGEGASKAIGQKMRALLSNQQGRVRLENSLAQIEDVATSLGGKFDDDIKDLVMFADGLDSKFGTTAKTSLAGQTEQAVSRAVTKPVSTAVETARKAVGKGAEKLKGINDFNAFESIEGLLK